MGFCLWSSGCRALQFSRDCSVEEMTRWSGCSLHESALEDGYRAPVGGGTGRCFDQLVTITFFCVVADWSESLSVCLLVGVIKLHF